MLKFTLTSATKLLNKKKVVEQLCRTTANQPVVRESSTEDSEKALKQFETLTNISRKQRTKKPKRPPFVKNLLVGEFDTEILTYPELEKEDVENLEKDASALRKLVHQSHMMRCNSISDKSFRQNLSDYKAIGMQAPQLMDGKECNVTESLRLLESLCEHDLRYYIVANEQLGANTLVKFASDPLKKKYLHPLMKGESVIALCLLENKMLDFLKFSTQITLSQDEKTMILNGTKTWVINGSSADVFLVFALSKKVKVDRQLQAKLTALVVEKDFPGVSVTKSEDGDIETAEVTFKDVSVPIENVIGEIHNGHALLPNIISEYRLDAAPLAIALTKKMLNSVTDRIIKDSNTENMLHKQDAIREKMGEIATTLYAMESVAYLTSGLIDTYENQDCELECAISKLFCSDYALKVATKCLELVGTAAFSNSNDVRKCYDQIIPLSILFETNANLKVIVASLGMQHAGITLNETIHKMRNPFYYSTYAIKRIWENRRNDEDNPKLDLNLGHYVHPTLGNCALNIEYCVKKIAFVTEILLSRFGPETPNYHMQLRRLADCLIYTYVMTAVVARASRSYCIGLQFAESEIVLASAFCNYGVENVRKGTNDIYAGRYETNDENYRVISKRLFQSKEYFAKHPLIRNF